MEKVRGTLIPAFILFLAGLLYLMMFVMCVIPAIQPDYFQGLVYLIPYTIYLFFAVLASKKRINKFITILVSLAFSLIAWIVMPLQMLDMVASNDATITDINLYDRVLEVVDYPDNKLVELFPDEIAKSHQVESFSYDPRSLMEGETLLLDFKASESDLQEYEETFDDAAIWRGVYQETDRIEDNYNGGIRWSKFSGILNADMRVYFFECQPTDDTWSYAKISMAAIDRKNLEILLYMEDY